MCFISRRYLTSMVLATLIFTCTGTALAVPALFESQSGVEQEQVETKERIQAIQEKLKLLQEKLQALERRKAAQQTEADDILGPDVPPAANWQPIDETVVDPGEFGVYTYLLFVGDLEDTAAVGALEDLLLTIETLPLAEDPPASQGNRFLVPVELPQSAVRLGHQPYDFKLSNAYLRRFGLESHHKGPILVSSTEPVDPYGSGTLPEFMAVNPAQMVPQQTRLLLNNWHRHEAAVVNSNTHALAGLLADLLHDTGPALIERSGNRLLLNFTR